MDRIRLHEGVATFRDGLNDPDICRRMQRDGAMQMSDLLDRFTYGHFDSLDNWHESRATGPDGLYRTLVRTMPQSAVDLVVDGEDLEKLRAWAEEMQFAIELDMGRDMKLTHIARRDIELTTWVVNELKILLNYALTPLNLDTLFPLPPKNVVPVETDSETDDDAESEWDSEILAPYLNRLFFEPDEDPNDPEDFSYSLRALFAEPGGRDPHYGFWDQSPIKPKRKSSGRRRAEALRAMKVRIARDKALYRRQRQAWESPTGKEDWMRAHF